MSATDNHQLSPDVNILFSIPIIDFAGIRIHQCVGNLVA